MTIYSLNVPPVANQQQQSLKFLRHLSQIWGADIFAGKCMHKLLTECKTPFNALCLQLWSPEYLPAVSVARQWRSTMVVSHQPDSPPVTLVRFGIEGSEMCAYFGASRGFTII